jgi:hypothetical protein
MFRIRARSCYRLVADGPISLDVTYSFTEHDEGGSVHGRLGIRRRRGLTAQLLRAPVAALLNAGTLAGALRKLEDSLGAPAPRGVFARSQCGLVAAKWPGAARTIPWRLGIAWRRQWALLV